MLAIRRSGERGHANHGWLDSFHTFSFADYHDPNFMGFRALRVINEDVVAPAQGFATHPHRDMEILTYVMSGELAHKDSMGNGRVVKPGEVQGMSAGTGVTHSEFNASDKTPVHLLQIWILPHTKGVAPSYAEWYPKDAAGSGFRLAASADGKDGSIRIHQDARMYVAVAKEAETLDLPVAPGRFGWLQMAKGSAELSGQKLSQGDGVAFSHDAAAKVSLAAGSQALLFDLA